MQRIWCVIGMILFAAAPLSSGAPDVSGIQSPLIYYGNWSDDDIPAMSQFDLVALQPGHYQGADESLAIQRIRSTGTYVLMYISIGEDSETFNGKPPRTGDGRGPAYYDPDLQQIVYEHRGIAGFYLDQWNAAGSVSGDSRDRYSDGIPDRHGDWGACYVHAGDPAWQQIIIEQAEELARYRIDGFFLDTPETPNPWQGYGWTAEGMYDLIGLLDTHFPDHLLLLNRGMFYFDPNKPYQYAWNPAEFIDIALFESYTLDNSYERASGDPLDFQISPYHELNRYYVSPKVNAALSSHQRTIPVINIDYARDPMTFPERYPELYQQILSDAVHTQGRKELITDRYLSEISTVIIDHPPEADRSAPRWQNTTLGKKTVFDEYLFYDVIGFDYTKEEFSTAVAPSRPGVRKVIPGDRQLTVLWDVATDQSHPVRYNIYYTTTLPFDITRAELLADVPYIQSPDYTDRGYTSADDACPYEYTITGLTAGQPCYVIVRAEDSTTGAIDLQSGRRGPNGGIEETNTRILAGIPLPMGPQTIRIDGKFNDWAAVPAAAFSDPAATQLSELRIHDDQRYLYLQLTVDGIFDLSDSAVYLNTDGKAYTGHPGFNGADYRFLAGSVYDYTWDWNYRGDITPLYSYDGSSFELALPKEQIAADHIGHIVLIAAYGPQAGTIPATDTSALSYQLLDPPTDTQGPLFKQGEPSISLSADTQSVLLSWPEAEDPNGPVVYDLIDSNEHTVLTGSTDTEYAGIMKNRIRFPVQQLEAQLQLTIRARDSLGNSTSLAPVTFDAVRRTEQDILKGIIGIQDASAGAHESTVYFSRSATGRYPAMYHLTIESSDDLQRAEYRRNIRVEASDKPAYEYMYTVTGLSGSSRYTFSLTAEDQYGNTRSDLSPVTVRTSGAPYMTRGSIDGQFDDWELDPQVVLVGTDVIENRPKGLKIYDIDTLSYVFHADTLFLLTTITGEPAALDKSVCYYLNTDGDDATGYSSHGYDIRIEGDGTVSALADSHWRVIATPIGTIPIAISSDKSNRIELALPGELIGGFSDPIQVYLRFGSQPPALTRFDDFGPFTLYHENRSLPTEREPFPQVIIYSIAGFFIMVLLFLNWAILPQLHHTAAVKGLPPEKQEDTDRNDYTI